MQRKTGKSVQRETTSARSGADLVCSETYKSGAEGEENTSDFLSFHWFTLGFL